MIHDDEYNTTINYAAQPVMHDPGATHHQAPMDLSHHVALEGQGHHGRSKIGLLRFDFAAWGRKKKLGGPGQFFKNVTI